MLSISEDICQRNYVLQAITASGAQIHIFCYRNVIKHKHQGCLSDDERTAYEDALVWVEQHTADSLERAIAILERTGLNVVLV